MDGQAHKQLKHLSASERKWWWSVLYFDFHDLLATSNTGVENCHWKIISELDQL